MAEYGVTLAVITATIVATLAVFSEAVRMLIVNVSDHLPVP